MAEVIRERETEERLRRLDMADIVEGVHQLEDEIKRFHPVLEALEEIEFALEEDPDDPEWSRAVRELRSALADWRAP